MKIIKEQDKVWKQRDDLYFEQNERNDRKMKRRWLAGILCAVLAVSLTGCGGTLSNKYISIEKYQGLEIEPV